MLRFSFFALALSRSFRFLKNVSWSWHLPEDRRVGAIPRLCPASPKTTAVLFPAGVSSGCFGGFFRKIRGRGYLHGLWPCWAIVFRDGLASSKNVLVGVARFRTLLRRGLLQTPP